MPFRRTQRPARYRSLSSLRPSTLEALEDRRLLSLTPEMVADIDTFGAGSNAALFTQFGDWTYFVASSDSGRDLWRTDGTPGLVERVSNGGANPDILSLAGDRLFFSAYDSAHGNEIWMIDAPGDSPRLMADLSPGQSSTDVRRFAAAGDRVFFAAWIQGFGYELWSTDGTAAGTTKLTNFSAANFFLDYPIMAGIGDQLFFFVKLDNGYELWKSDGSAEGTAIVRSFAEPGGGIKPESFAATGSLLFFIGFDAGHGDNPWRTDGTPEGTFMLKDVEPGPSGGWVDRFAAWGDQAVFHATDPLHSFETWISDGTPEGTRLLVDSVPGTGWGQPDDFTPIGDDLYFVSNHNALGREVWRYNRITDTARVIKDIRPGGGSSSPTSLIALGDELYFAADDGVHGLELWKSNGTAEGTTLAFEMQPGSGSSFNLFSAIVAAGDRLYFNLTDANYDTEPWVSDGTAEGTQRLADIRVGTSDSTPREFTVLGDYLYFVAHVWVNVGTALWRTPLHGSGVELVKKGFSVAPRDLVVAGNRLYFNAGTTQYGTELWSSDGTTAGTAMVKDIKAGTGHSEFKGMFAQGDRVLFFVDRGNDLWTSDGTAEGTVLLQDFGRWQMDTLKPASLLGSLYFWVTTGNDFALWKSDGTTEGTTKVREVRDPTWMTYSGQELVSDGARLYFSAQDVNAGIEPWTSDGTSEGTQLLKDIRPGAPWESPSYPSSFTVVGNLVYFTAFDSTHGYELWRSDGTSEGTSMLAELAPGANEAKPSKLTAVGDDLYFVFDDGAHGEELWVANETGVRLLKDVRPGPDPSRIHSIVPVRGGVLFFADNGETGWEPWQANSNGANLIADIFAGPTYSHSPYYNAYARSVLTVGDTVYLKAANEEFGSELWKIGIPVGDTNFDGEINLEDLNNVRNHFGGTGLGDADDDGDVDLDDLNLVRNHFGGAPAAAMTAARRSGIQLKQPVGAGEKRWERAVDVLFGAANTMMETDGVSGARKLKKTVRG